MPFDLAGMVIALAALAMADPEPLPVAVPDRPEPASYANEVADILDAKCVGCHNGALAENRLNLEDVASMIKGGKSGPSIVPGKADESLLFKMAAHRVEPVMPPREKKDQKPLTAEELGLLKLWIDGGARDDSEENPSEPKTIELGTLPPGVHPIVAADLTVDGRRVAAGRANVVEIFDVESGVQIISLGGHQDIIQSLRFSPAGDRLAAGSYQVVTVWNAPTGALSATFSGHEQATRAVEVSRDGATVYSAGQDRTLRIWDRQGKELRKIDLPLEPTALAVAPDGQTLGVGGADGQVLLVSLGGDTAIRSLKGHAGPVFDVTFLPAGDRLVSASADATIRVWPTSGEGEPSVLNGHEGAVRALGVSADGQWLASGGEDGSIRLWHPGEDQPVRVLPASGSPVNALAIDPAGRVLVAGCADHSVRLFDLAKGEMRQTLGGHLGPVHSVAFSPSGARFASAGQDGGVKLWETESGRGVIAFGHKGAGNEPIQPIHGVAFADDGTVVTASADKTLKSWTFQGTWGNLRTFDDHVFRVLALDFSPDGNLLATGGGEPSRSGEVKIWEVTKGFLVRALDTLHSDTVFGVEFSPDGTMLATGSADKFVKVTKLVGGKEFRSYEGHTNHVLGVDWNAEGTQVVSAGADNVLKLWSIESGEQIRTIAGANKQVTAVRWLPGKPLVAGASGDGQVRLWNVDNGNVQRAFPGAGDFVMGLAVSADGLRIVAGDATGTLFVWNGEDARVLHKLAAPSTTTARNP